MGRPSQTPAIAVVAAIVVMTGCTGDSTRGAEYEAVLAERNNALAHLDDVSEQLDDALSDLDQLESELADIQDVFDETVATNAKLTVDLRAAEATVAELQEQITDLELLLEAWLLLDIDREVERVCAQIIADASGDAVADAALLISFESRWKSLVAPADIESRVETCAGFDYLTTIALGAEFGGDNNVVNKWVTDVRILVAGSPTDEDLVALDETITGLNRLIDSLAVSRVSSGPSELTVHFIPVVEFEQVLSQYVPGNDGFFWISWNLAHEITIGTILIRVDGIDQSHRSHLVREEVTQAFGLMNDSFRYDASIFQQSWTAVNDYAAIDEVIIAMLYRREVLPGMGEDELRSVFDWKLGS